MVTIMILELLLISIHALREEGDTETVDDQLARVLAFQSTPSARRATVSAVEKQKRSVKFQSTPSARRATITTIAAAEALEISIHALREEGDSGSNADGGRVFNFNPRPPRGGRLDHRGEHEMSKEFQSTPSARRATTPARALCRALRISIHALREEGDPFGFTCGRCPVLISIHALREEGDEQPQKRLSAQVYFNPRPPRGGRRLMLSLKLP